MTLPGGNRKVLVVGSYRFTGRQLGKGNFARVEEAVHNILNIKVAVKIMDINQIKEEYVIRNLCREAKLMAKLNHPSITALYQTMQRSDNVYYLITELATGGDLCTFIKNQRYGKLEERPTRIYARQFVSALSHMHNLGVVHRDLKMENVMLNSAQTQIKIVDFGLSNVYSSEEPLRTHCGSPEYAAPELFVTGKKYGPEVDLWSLGIILYGMVVGQLPFVSNRTETISSQERRKKLVAQINKGLSTNHRRALVVFSTDFRNMMNRMLVADASKRINIKDLVVHPWITEKGMKLIRSNPIKRLEPQQQAKVIAELCELTRQPPEEVLSIIKHEPMSKIGGMYNILSHRYSLSRLQGDGVTRNLPTLDLDDLTRGDRNSHTKGPYNLRVSTSRTISRNTVTVGRGDDVYSSKGDVYTPRVILQEKRLIQVETRVRSPKQALRCRPKTVEPELSEKQDYRTLKSPSLRRKAYSASITPKTTRPSTVSEIANKVAKSVECKIVKNVVKRLYPGISEVQEKGLTNTIGNIRRQPLKNIKPGTKQEYNEPPRAQTAIDRKQRSKSERISAARPDTSVTSGTSGFRRPLKPTNVLKITTTQSDSKTTNRPATDTRAYIKGSRQRNSDRPPLSQMEKSPMAFGDFGNKTQSSIQKMKKPIIYDPIARSIAGYVVNNVPDKLPNISFFKK